MRIKTLARCVLALALFGAFNFQSVNLAAANGNLGVGLRVIPGGSGTTESGLTGNTKLWFVVKQGETFSRDLLLTGSSTLDQKVSLSLVQLARVDGEPSVTNVVSEVSPWVIYSKNDFILKKNDVANVRISVSPPVDLKSSSFEAYLVVTASGLESITKDDGITKAVIKNSARVAQPVFIGVGNYEDFKINFEIKDVDGIKNSDGKFIRVFIDNQGKTPISPSGTVQIKNLDFEQAAIGPFEFYSATIAPKSKAFIDVPIPSAVNPGNWKIFVRATQGSVTETSEFTKNLTFSNSFDYLGWGLRALITAIGIFLALWSYRTFRPHKDHGEIMARTKKAKISDETAALIAELEAKTAALEAEVAKKTVRKKAAKKSAKKATVKKAAVSAPKKAVVKKTAKKAATKKPQK